MYAIQNTYFRFNSVIYSLNAKRESTDLQLVTHLSLFIAYQKYRPTFFLMFSNNEKTDMILNF
jgi:hypothetical protein